MKTIHPGHLEHRFCIFGCQILCITDLAIMPRKSLRRNFQTIFITYKNACPTFVPSGFFVCRILQTLEHFNQCFLHTFEKDLSTLLAFVCCITNSLYHPHCSPKSRVQWCLTASSLSTETLLSNPVQRRYVNTITVQRRHAKRMAPDAKSRMQT